MIDSDELFALSDDELERRVIAEIRTFAPAMPEETLFRRIYRWKEAVALAPGGTMTEMYELRRQRYPGVRGLFLAGGYMDVPGGERRPVQWNQRRRGCRAFLDRRRGGDLKVFQRALCRLGSRHPLSWTRTHADCSLPHPDLRRLCALSPSVTFFFFRIETWWRFGFLLKKGCIVSGGKRGLVKILGT